MARVFIGLGSNLGDRTGYLVRAVEMISSLSGTLVVGKSSILETEAVDYLDQPDFLNQVILVNTNQSPHELLENLKQIEEKLGRIRRFNKGPREIDLDILLYDDLVISDENLELPHPGIVKRDFVIKHLIEIEPEISDPVTGDKYRSLIC